MTPLGDAVGFVDGDACELTLRVDGPEAASEGLGQGVLRGDVEKACVRVAWIKTVSGVSLSPKM